MTTLEFGAWWSVVVLAVVAWHQLIERQKEKCRMADTREELIWNGQVGDVRIRVTKKTDTRVRPEPLVTWDLYREGIFLATGVPPDTRGLRGDLDIDTMRDAAARIAKACARAYVLGVATEHGGAA